MIGLTVADFLPAAVYLTAVTLLVFSTRSCPTWVHPVFLAVGLPVRMLETPWPQTLIPVGLTVVVFVVGVLFTSRLVTGVTLFTLATSLTVLPLHGWVAIGGGLGAAFVHAVWKTVRLAGRDRVALLGMQTLHAIGMSPAGLHKPDLDHMPTREQAMPEETEDGNSKRARMYLPPYLLAGVVVTAALTLL